MRILISGAFGFIGKPLASFLASEGHQVVALTRKAENIESERVFWDPEKKKANPKDFEGFHAVVHLAAEPLAFSRWSKRKKENILQSRVLGTLFLSHLLNSTVNPPDVFISASAVGYYGDRGEEELLEGSPEGSGFLARVCSSWEKASLSLKRMRVVHARFGMVLAEGGGALKKIIPLYNLGLGARLGSGKQWVSWVARDDLIRAISHILKEDSIEGPVNVVSPNPIRQIEFSKALAELLHRPHFLFIPKWVLLFLLGDVAKELLLSSSRAIPSKLLATNFVFQYPGVRSALKKALQLE